MVPSYPKRPCGRSVSYVSFVSLFWTIVPRVNIYLDTCIHELYIALFKIYIYPWKFFT